MNKKIEVLAPAGSYEIMRAALKAGADAVYIGGSKFGARAFADNPDSDEMLNAIDYVHLHGKQLYLTVNTLLKNREIEGQLKSYIKPLYEQGLDAVIVQDIGVLDFIRYYFPDLSVHASTQMTICGLDYALWLKKQGVTRIVTPRELSINEIAVLKENTGLEIETFVHGALCYCYSGQCLMSSMIGGRSGNRGRCAQPCRLNYTFQGPDQTVSGYLLSPKDLNGLTALPELISAGVDSLKIEGRMKKPEYAALTTAVYRHYVDLYLEKGSRGYKIDQTDIDQLMDLYNRGGFTKGYFYMHNGKDMMSNQRPNHSGLMVGHASQKKPGEITMTFQTDVHAGDVLELPDGSNIKIQRDVEKGNFFKTKYAGQLSGRGMKVMRTRNESLIRSVTEKYVKNYQMKEKILGVVKILKDFPATIDVYLDDYHVHVESEIVQEALKQPLKEEDVRKRLMKTGQTAFEFEALEIEMDQDVYVGVQALNQLRRDALEQLESMILYDYRRIYKEKELWCINENNHEISKTKLHVLVTNLQQLDIVLKYSEVTRIYINDEGDDTWIQMACSRIHASAKEVYIGLPYIIRQELSELLDARIHFLKTYADGFLARNMEGLLLVKREAAGFKCISDYQIYGMNDFAQQKISMLADGQTLPMELNKKEIQGMRFNNQNEWVVYGYLPVMVSAQCLVKNYNACRKEQGIYYLVDRINKRLKVKNICFYCYNLIYNAVPLNLRDAVLQDIDKIHPNAVRIQFLDETTKRVEEIMNVFVDDCVGEDRGMVSGEFTKGHYQRGVE